MYFFYIALILLLNYYSYSETQKDTITTDEITVTAAKNPILFSSSARIINSVNKKNFQSLPNLNFYDVLKKSFNVDIRQRGNFGVQSDISIRGGNSDQVLILLNGIYMNDPQTGHHNLNLPLDLNSVSKIEVLEGSSSRIYGLNAFSGVINFITEIPDSQKTKVSIDYGMNNYLNINANTSFQYKTFKNYLSITKSQSDGYSHNTDFKNFNLFYRGSLDMSVGELSLQGGYTNKAFGANSFYSAQFPDQYEETKTYFITAKYDNKKENNTVIEFFAREHFDKYQLFRNEKPDWDTIPYIHQNDVIGYNQKHRLVWLLGITNLGFSFRSEEIMSTTMGKPMMPEAIDGEFRKFFFKSAFRLVSSAYLEHNVFWNGLMVSAGLNLTGIRNYDYMIDPGIDISYKINDNLSVFGNVNSAHRMPSFTDLYYSDPASLGNVNLKPEESITFESGVRYLNNFMKLQLAAFYKNGTNLIDWVKAPQDTLWRSTNLGKVLTKGGEIFINLYPKNLLGKNFILENIDISYCYTFIENNSGIELSEYVLNYLKHKINSSILIDLPFDLKLSFNMSYNARIGKYYDYQSQTIKEFEPYLLTDSQLNYEYRAINFNLQAKNLFGVNYIDISNVKLPGRWVGCGIKLIW